MVSKMISNSAVKEFFAEHGILYKKQEKKKKGCGQQGRSVSGFGCPCCYWHAVT